MATITRVLGKAPIPGAGGGGGAFHGSLMSAPITYSIQRTDSTIKIGGQDRLRKRTVFQNNGPGTIWLSTEDRVQAGFQIVPGGTFSDEPPFNHQGPWFLSTDQAGTAVVGGFYS